MDFFGRKAQLEVERLRGLLELKSQELAASNAARDMLRGEVHRMAGRVDVLEDKLIEATTGRVDDLHRVTDNAFKSAGRAPLFTEGLSPVIPEGERRSRPKPELTAVDRRANLAEIVRKNQFTSDAILNNLGPDEPEEESANGHPGQTAAVAG